MREMFKLGITGGIGSGKSTVCKIFELLCVPIYSSDTRAKQLMVESAEVNSRLRSEFGDDVYLPGGVLNKPVLSRIIFSNPGARACVNGIVHPVVMRDFLSWSERIPSPSGYVIMESALLFESDIHAQLDATLSVFCPLAERVERVVRRDHCSYEEADLKINSQIPDDELLKLSEYFINCGSKDLVVAQVLCVHDDINSKLTE